MLLSFPTGFNLVNAAVVCAILESISGLEPSSDTTDSLSPCTRSLWLSPASVHLLWSPCWCRWCCLSSTWSPSHWSQCRKLWKLCRVAQLILPVLPLMLSHRRHQQSGDWWLFCLQSWQKYFSNSDRINRGISLSSKIRLMRSLVTFIFLYAYESWAKKNTSHGNEVLS